MEQEQRQEFKPLQPETSPTAKEVAGRLIEVEYLSGEFPNRQDLEELSGEGWLLDDEGERMPLEWTDPSGVY